MSKIAFQGELGANSHIACRDVHPDFEPLPCATFEDVFQAAATGEAALAMIPVENSIAGRVADIHHLLPTSPLQIIGRALHADPVPADGPARRRSWKTSRPPTATSWASASAGTSCARGASSQRTSSDTAGAAREVRELGDPTQAAIAPRLAAEVYGLDILAENIEDAAHNTTRFVIMSRDGRTT